MYDKESVSGTGRATDLLRVTAERAERVAVAKKPRKRPAVSPEGWRAAERRSLERADARWRVALATFRAGEIKRVEQASMLAPSPSAIRRRKRDAYYRAQAQRRG
jgi:hypothetical protein